MTQCGDVRRGCSGTIECEGHHSIVESRDGCGWSRKVDGSPSTLYGSVAYWLYEPHRHVVTDGRCVKCGVTCDEVDRE